MSHETVKLTIDGSPVEVLKGKTILEAAEQAGIHIPRYCYHPGLEIVGICRICQVEVKGVPNPVIACYTAAQDGQEVLTDSALVRRVRSGDLEFLLLNHPIDCPICDTSGECDLQNYYMTDGKHKSRLRHPKINREKKKRIGQNVILDQERCILCSRCVRFLRDVTGTHELGFFGKGSTSYIDIVEGKTLNGNLYAGNIVDLCPVGALTDDDFRFKCRVWYLSAAPSICPHCARGCNIEIHFNADLCWKNDSKRIMRIKPRYNPNVNHYWMCDIGRYNYDFAEQPSRIKRPLEMRGGEQVEVTWEEALQSAAGYLKPEAGTNGSDRIGIIPSLWITNEAAYLLRRLFIDQLGVKHVGFRRGGGERGDDGFLLLDDRFPNRFGLELIGCAGPEGGRNPVEILKMAADGRLETLVYVQDLPDRVPEKEILEGAREGLRCLIVLASNTSPITEMADLVLPVCPWSEDHGTWVNSSGLIQWLTPALPPVGYSRITAEVITLLGRALGVDPGEAKPSLIFDELVKEVEAFAGMSYRELGDFGKPCAGAIGAESDRQLPDGKRR